MCWIQSLEVLAQAIVMCLAVFPWLSIMIPFTCMQKVRAKGSEEQLEKVSV